MAIQRVLEACKSIDLDYPLWVSPEAFRIAFESYAGLWITPKSIINEDIIFFTYNTIIGSELDIIIITHYPYYKEDEIILSNSNYKEYECYISCKAKSFEEFKALLSMRVEYFYIYSFNPIRISEEEVLRFCYELNERNKIILNPEGNKMKQGVKFIIAIYDFNHFLSIGGDVMNIIKLFEDIVFSDI